jgi:hypothetical protein
MLPSFHSTEGKDSETILEGFAAVAQTAALNALEAFAGHSTTVTDLTLARVSRKNAATKERRQSAAR